MAELVGVCLEQTRQLQFYDRAGLALERGEYVLVQTDRGLQLAVVVVPLQTVEAEDTPAQGVVRVATQEDLDRAERLGRKALEALQKCREKITQHKLPMRLIDAEYTFDERKLIFYFTSESRVDFRRLVKDLASTFRTRIELLRIGVRDAARVTGGYGPCGRPLCCATFTHEFRPASIRMAKEQGASLTPSRISGGCGRLKCCISYEYEVYKEARRGLPGKGAVCSVDGVEGRVVDVNPLQRQVLVDLGEDGQRWVGEEALGNSAAGEKREDS